MRIFRSLLTASVLTLCTVSSAFVTYAEDKADKNHDQYVNYYEDEGQLLFKIRGTYSIANTKPKSLPQITNGASALGRLTNNAFGFDTATTYFFTKNIAAEIALGLNYYKVKSSALDEAFKAYGRFARPSVKNDNIFIIPLSASVQYHIAPYGGIRPYVGAGYHVSYPISKSSAFKIKAGHGPLLQAGVDLVAKDDTLITIDVKQHFFESKITYKNNFLNRSNSVSGKIKWNPVIVSAGIGFRF